MVYHACKSDGRYHRPTGARIPPRRLIMVPLIAAAVLGVKQPAANAEFNPPGPDTFCANNAVTDFACQLSSTPYSAVFSLPELGGSFVFISNGHFIMGSDGARLTGDIVGGSLSAEFSVAIDFSGRTPADPGTVVMGLRSYCADPSTWTQFTEISGELVGLPGSGLVDARYAITKRSNDAQFGEGANTHNTLLGLFANIYFELVDNPHDIQWLPAGSYWGSVSASLEPSLLWNYDPPDHVNQSCFPPAEPDLTGTWTGTIVCAGFDAEAGASAVPVARSFSAAELKIGRSTNALDVGDQYSARLTRETGNSQSLCAYAPNNPGSATGGQGVLVEPQRQATRVYFRFEGESLKARELIADGLHGTQLCKWSFTRANTTPPIVADACPPMHGFACLFPWDPDEDQCNDNALCGRGRHPTAYYQEFSCTCKDGFFGNGYTDTGCTPAP